MDPHCIESRPNGVHDRRRERCESGERAQLHPVADASSCARKRVVVKKQAHNLPIGVDDFPPLSLSVCRARPKRAQHGHRLLRKLGHRHRAAVLKKTERCSHKAGRRKELKGLYSTQCDNLFSEFDPSFMCQNKCKCLFCPPNKRGKQLQFCQFCFLQCCTVVARKRKQALLFSLLNSTWRTCEASRETPSALGTQMKKEVCPR